MSTTTTPPRASPAHTPDDSSPPIPTATLALPSTVPTTTTTRRLPPPCWNPEETLALIQAYRDKWYSLRRGNLRANHWQEVADEIATKSPVPTPKTAVQCRHKMEKLRKRYRAEIQRAGNHGGLRRYNSPWAHFNFMHEMEKGPEINKTNNPPTPPSSSDEEDEDDEHDRRSSVKRINDLYNSSANQVNSNVMPTGFRIKIPGRVISSPPVGQFDGMNGGMNPNPSPYLNNPYPNPNFNMNQSRFGTFGGVGVNGGAGSSKISREGFSGKKVIGEVPKKRKAVNGGAMNEIVTAVQALGEGFMRIEKAKMDMVRHVEEMRMEMELKRTEMVLESQQRIVEAFAKAVTERKRMKKKASSTDMNHSNE